MFNKIIIYLKAIFAHYGKSKKLSNSYFDEELEHKSFIEEDQLEHVAKINPLEPYKTNYFNSSLFEKQERPLSKEDFDTLFDKHISLEAFTNAEKAPYLKKLYEDSLFVYHTLSPLRLLNLNFTLDITGGAVRDFVLNNHQKIKDLDFMISFSWGNNFITKEDLLSKAFFTEEEIAAVDWQDFVPSSELKHKLLLLCFNRTQTITDTFYHEPMERSYVEKDPDGYNGFFTKDRLISVTKLSQDKTHYPIDLLLTDYIKPEFLKDFDFDICKASICIVNDAYKKDLPDDYTHLVSRFNAPLHFWADVLHKKMTYDCFKRSKKHIQNSLTKRFERLQEKYPDYQINIVGNPESDLNYNLAKSLYAVYELEKTLVKKEDNNHKQRKLKI